MGANRLQQGEWQGESKDCPDPNRRPLKRSFLESMAASHAAAGEVVAICADPGMGKTQLARAVATIIRPDDEVAVCLTGLTPELSKTRLSRAVRRCTQRLRNKERLCVIIDDISPLDEPNVEKVDRLIAKLQQLGAAVILTLRPEAEQVLDGIERCVRIGKGELMVRASEISPQTHVDAIMRASGGVPVLVEALLASSFSRLPAGVITPVYGEALSAIVRESLRESVIEEERIARFAAVLLGQGTWDDLERVLGHAPADGIGEVLNEATLIALDHVSRLFRCIGADSMSGFVYCADVLKAAAARWPETASKAVGLLVSRGEVDRAARIIAWLEGDVRKTLALRHGFDLLDHAETDLVKEAVAEKAFIEDVSPYAQETLQRAFDSIWSRELGDAEWGPRDFATAEDERDFERANLMILSRRLLAKPVLGDGRLKLDRTDAMAAGLAAHAEALALFGKGRIGDCLSMLRLFRHDGGAYSLARALLCIDEEVARVLVCEDGAPDFERISSSEVFFERMGFTPLIGWGGVLESLRDTIRGEEPDEAFDAVSALAERRGNLMLAAALGCANVLCELLRGAPVSALVRLKRAEGLAERASCGVLADVCAILRSVCSGYLGEPDPCAGFAKRYWSCAGVGSIAEVLEAALSEGDVSRSEAPLPTDFLWLAVAIANLPGDLSKRFRECMGPMWARRLGEVKRDAPSHAGRVREAVAPAEEEPEEVPAAGIEISLLGEFALRVNGREVPMSKLSSRSAGTVLTFIAAAPNHRISRASLIESVWPGVDFESGRERMYQALSRIRRVVREYDESLDPISIARNDGSIGLNAETVRCDIDEFLETAQSIMSMEGVDESGIVDGAALVEKLYRGDLVKPLQDGTGTMRDRRRELRRIFVDVMVLGSDSALLLGKRRLSTHLAERAHIADSTREDVICALVRGLKSSGRTDEAVRQYQSFAKKLMRSKRRAPSHELREAMGSLIDDTGNVAVEKDLDKGA